MNLTEEQRVCLKCCRIGRSSTETFQHLQTVRSEKILSHLACLECSYQSTLPNNVDIIIEVVIKQEPVEELNEDVTTESMIKQESSITSETEIKEEPTEYQDEDVPMESKDEERTAEFADMKTIDYNNFENDLRKSIEIKEEPQTTIASSKESKLICDNCNFKFKTKYGLKRHLERYTENRKYFTCQVCDSSFDSKYNLDRHLRSHTGEKPYGCSSCDFKTGDRSNYVRHVKIHSGEKPFACKMCDYKSVERSKLKRHMKIHINYTKHLNGIHAK